MNNTIADKLEQIAKNEQLIYNVGYEKGKAEAEESDTSAAYEQGVADGKQAEYDAFWDAFQDNGNRTNYSYAFGANGWNDNNFKPKYNIQPIYADRMFARCNITDLKGILEREGVVLDLSLMTSATYFIENDQCKITRLPELNITSIADIQYFIYTALSLISIDKVILKSDGKNKFGNNSFGRLNNLEEIRFEGVIGQNGLNLQWSTKLSRESIESIINALSTATSGLTVTISKTAKENAFTDEEWASLIATKPNWTISLA
jgi:hypothetical protein